MHPSLLEQIQSPQDLSRLNPNQVAVLADEIRQTLIQTLSKNGGHLSANLGVVELTIALHLCFQSPEDALIWDVSHQSLTHKLLTGRYRDFHTLRRAGGLSSFTNPNESAHDHFFAGHASTSVSSALGIATAKRALGDTHNAVAILGDGAATGGMVYEALNNAGRGGAKMIVVLNDNEMSISKNVGGIPRYLSWARSRPVYRITKRRVENALRRMPLCGDCFAKRVAKIKNFIKRLLTQPTIFEDLGFAYIGPIDGHDINAMCAAFSSAKLIQRPVLVHCCTVKGKGYEHAELSPEAFHGVSCFDIETGEPTSACGSLSEDFGAYMCELAAENKEVCAVTAAMAIGTGLRAFERAYPARLFDVGIAESHAITFAAGLLHAGLRPVAVMYSTFLQRTYDQLLHDAALQNLPLTVCVDRAGFVGQDGATHHGLYDVAFCASIPNVRVYAVASTEELRRRLREAVLQPQNTLTFLRYARGKSVNLPADFNLRGDYAVYGDTSAVYAIVTYGRLTAEAVRAIEQLKLHGTQVKLIKLNCVVPIHAAAVEAVLNCKRVCFFEEGIRTAGAGERFAAMLLQHHFVGAYILHAADGFAPQGSVEELLIAYGLDCGAMCAAFADCE
ncbi:MAG: 1-deoxy-D-xylulose-5-phosphate synthase [Oscillospiraceae bacterium]|nr:1-deoxy-D-xylulose-5-phosphate synthase [Oscillospiraceae bacterium]